jgi:large subunit ribosomal protein L7/L12
LRRYHFGGFISFQFPKAVRKLTTLGLREAKAAVEETPTTLKEGVSKEEAEAVKAEIEQASGQVEIK